MGLLERKPRNADVIAKTPMRVIKLTHWEIRRMSEETLEKIKGIIAKRQQAGQTTPAA
jgi:CRP-like cAMP-binding protein